MELKENIGTTYNYNMFVFKKTNRDIDNRNLIRIDKEVKKEGWRKHPILVNQKGEVIDGQHRLVYAKKHQLPVYFIVANGLQDDDCQILNTTRKKWEAKDYIKFYSKQDNENYIRLGLLCDEFDFLPVPVIVSAIKTSCYGGTQQSAVKAGSLIVTETDYQRTKNKLRFYKKCAPYMANIKGRTSQLYNAIGFAFDLDEIDNERLLEVIKTRLKTITPPANLEWALRELEDIYNWHASAEQKVYLFTEYQKTVATPKSRVNRKNERR